MTAMNTLLVEPEPVSIPTASEVTPLRLLDFAEPRTRILYVDDDASTRRLGELVLARSGYDVDVANDGMEAWDALHDVNYNLLVTDHKMPRLTGLELVTQARLAGMRLPIVLATGSVDALSDPSTAWLGLAARLPKPFGSDTLVATVEHVLHGANHLGQHHSAMSSVLARLAQIQPYSRWGINE